ncbi:ABC transporter ATP-binding protein [Microcella alkaliphila]|uniref:ABC transporter ATP-binding protein n=1 Tax=Microcella alkaliphila TaxID=279828 RepID=A0A0U5B7Q8_9MICO|nr:ABC transporter ATP-binding protein [Microcella alkaliphila]
MSAAKTGQKSGSATPKRPKTSQKAASKKGPKAQVSPPTAAVEPPAPEPAPIVLQVDALTKRFGRTTAVDAVSFDVRRGSIFGFVGPNGAGKTTTLGMVTGLLRPDSGRVQVGAADVWAKPVEAKQLIGVLPDRMRLFDLLTGAQLLYYCGVLHGLDRETARTRTADLARSLGLDDALERPVRDYSIGMIKKISLAAALIHSPRLLVLDEPFEAVDPVSTQLASDVLRRYADAGGTVVLSSHNMNFVERMCDEVAVIVGGRILAHGPMDEVRDGLSLEERFVELAGGRQAVEGLEWLTTFSD